MDPFTVLGVIVVLTILIVVVSSLVLDADLTTIVLEKCGANVTESMKGKVVWVTGASTGIGASLTMELLRSKAKVVISARREALLEEVKAACLKEVSTAATSDILVLPMDMCDLTSHQKKFSKVLEIFGRLDILVNNAGRSQRARWEHTDIQVDKDLFELNVFSVINLTRLVLPHMLERKAGCVAVMSSSAGKAGAPFSGSYTGSKHALHGYFESLRNESVGSGVSVVMLCPGPTFSNLLQSASTEKVGEKFGEEMGAQDKRMTGQRCAQLSLIAIANAIPESWICFRPVLPLMYINQYLPSVSKFGMKLLGPTFLAKVRDSRNAMESDKYK